MAKLADIVNGKGKSLIPQTHLRQIDRFLWRNGIELFPVSDENEVKTKLLNYLWKLNRTSIHLSDIWLKGAVTGKVLIYLRPQGRDYRLSYFDGSEFTTEHDEFGDLDRVTIQRTYRKDKKIRWYKLTIDKTQIQKWDGDTPQHSLIPDSVIENRYGFIPCVVIENEAGGSPEFSQVKGQIETHDWLLEQTYGNIEFFGGPIFFSSRSRQEMIEAGHISYSSVAEVGGYGSPKASEHIKARRVFDNLEPGEQIGFASPEPIPTGTLDFIDRYCDTIRTALGGVSEDKIHSESGSPSGTEIKTYLAKAINTATRKAERYVTFGIAEAYSMMLKMAHSDRLLTLSDYDFDVGWRYLGDVFPESPRESLTKSIVGRNLLRLGVNVEECIRYVFPDKREEEIRALLKEGFAYEFLNGIASVAQTLHNAKDPETGEWAIQIDQFITEVLAGRPSDDRQPNTQQPRTKLVFENDRELEQPVKPKANRETPDTRETPF